LAESLAEKPSFARNISVQRVGGAGPPLREFLHTQATSLIAVDFTLLNACAPQ
jgi:hypothetical protein